MSTHHHYSILCDEPDCTAEFNAGEITVTPTRAAAARQGWSYVVLPPCAGHTWPRNLDYCPAHRRPA